MEGGFVRHIDNLGRVVIPREIRKTLNLQVNDPLEFIAGGDGLYLKKRASLSSHLSLLGNVIRALQHSAGVPVYLCDRNRILDVAGADLEVQDLSLPEEIRQAIKRGNFVTVFAREGQPQKLFKNLILVCPIQLFREISGALLLPDCRDIEETKKLAQFACKMFGELVHD